MKRNNEQQLRIVQYNNEMIEFYEQKLPTTLLPSYRRFPYFDFDPISKIFSGKNLNAR